MVSYDGADVVIALVIVSIASCGLYATKRYFDSRDLCIKSGYTQVALPGIGQAVWVREER